MKAGLNRSHSLNLDSEDSGDLSNGKRKRFRTSRYEFSFLDNEEQRQIQQALKLSMKETKRIEVEIPDAPVYHPTVEEFRDPLQYLRKIRAEVEPFGICKVVPPPEWNPPRMITLDNPKQFSTRQQPIHTLQQGQGFDDGKKYTIGDYKKMADQFKREWLAKYHPGEENVTLEMLCKDYWDIVETNSREVTVEYGNDIDTSVYGSGFPLKPENLKGKIEEVDKDYMKRDDYYYLSNWNVNNIPAAPGSLLKYVKTPITGINVPWLYVGMLFSSFCFHTEDNYFYSINYSHFGSEKQWYGVPGSDASKFEKVSKDYLMGLFRESPDILHHMTTQISPSILYRNGVHVYKVTQEPKTFIFTFPRSYHGGFNYGFNCNEAVNFATLDWIPIGSEALDRYRLFGRESAFSTQRLLFTVLQHKHELQTGTKRLTQETEKILREELSGRAGAIGMGVRDLSGVVALKPNNFEIVDDQATDYDDMRNCCICKQTCLFTAIACECDQAKVGCLRHFHVMCKCANAKKFMLAWGSNSDLESLLPVPTGTGKK